MPGDPRAAMHLNVVLVGASMRNIAHQAMAMRMVHVALTAGTFLLGSALARGAHSSMLASVLMAIHSSSSGLSDSSPARKGWATCPGSSRRLGYTCRIWALGAVQWRPVQPQWAPWTAASKRTTRRPCLDG